MSARVAGSAFAGVPKVVAKTIAEGYVNINISGSTSILQVLLEVALSFLR